MTEHRAETLIWISAGIALLILLWLLTPILLPFVLGAALAYLGDPIVDRLERWRMSRTTGVTIVFTVITLGALLVTALLIPLLQQQVQVFLQRVPEYLQWAQDVLLPTIGVQIPEGGRIDAESLRSLVQENWEQAGSIVRELLLHATRSTGTLLTLVVNILMVPVVTFYLLRDWDRLLAWLDTMIPRRMIGKVREIARETDDVLAAFLRGQLAVMTSLAVIYSTGLWIAGLDLALLIGIGAGLVSFVPYLGLFVGLTAAVIAMLFQEQALLPVIWVLLVFGIGQILETAVLTPLLVGDRIGLHPVAVIFAILAGGQLFGFVGVLLALPASAGIAVLLRHTKQRWLHSPLYAGPGDD
ncbi:AI-2E family transporter [Algiphilus sp.]|uniref:AI-2E family transporter n=2 Tax=Algiphilus sp. TaxID=1872431 RepID=UPI001CA5F7DB|nr:AI-2E family transporter [Algiphilus sp.]MBY8966064.1 AI-2E family transporter [Algiphilus acroporae]MCI5062030.1 AI-2E family transporter [Algiphilus sp.]MCI5104862.1 AI-2E family transporter [Algiphilus sp.]MCR9092472.1 AI-2E family transporter [Pseudomonadota bacterium]